jgi:RHS repeat-associated protein
VKEARSGNLTVFVYSGINVIYEETLAVAGDPVVALNADLSSLQPTSRVDYVRANGQIVARIIPGTDPNGYLPFEEATYFQLDHLGSTRVLSDQQGQVTARMDYEPFGSLLPGISASDPYAFTGQRTEEGTGLYYYGARYYDPEVGRFITADSWTNLPDDERGHVVADKPLLMN